VQEAWCCLLGGAAKSESADQFNIRLGDCYAGWTPKQLEAEPVATMTGAASR